MDKKMYLEKMTFEHVKNLSDSDLELTLVFYKNYEMIQKGTLSIVQETEKSILESEQKGNEVPRKILKDLKK